MLHLASSTHGAGSDAWTVDTPHFKHGIPDLFLQKMLELLANPTRTPNDLRLSHRMLDPGGVLEADLPELCADARAFCSVHPCAHRCPCPRSAHLRPQRHASPPARLDGPTSDNPQPHLLP